MLEIFSETKNTKTKASDQWERKSGKPTITKKLNRTRHEKRWFIILQ